MAQPKLKLLDSVMAKSRQLMLVYIQLSCILEMLTSLMLILS